MKKRINILFSFVLILGLITQMIPRPVIMAEENNTVATATIRLQKMDAIETSHEIEIEDEAGFVAFRSRGEVTYKGLDPNEVVDKEAPLEGTVFVLKKGEDEVFTATSDAQGNVTFEQVPAGTYALYEKEATPGFVKIRKRIAMITIDQTGGDVNLGKIYNKRGVGSIKVIKVDESNNARLPGVKFELRKDNKKVLEGTTNENGEITFSDVVGGKYTLVETEAREGYVLNSTPQEIVVLANEMVEKTISNKQKTVTVILHKVESNIYPAVPGGRISATANGTENAENADFKELGPVPNTEFILKQDGVEKFTSTSNEQGIVEFRNIPTGEYELEEKTAAEGFEKLNGSLMNFVIAEDSPTAPTDGSDEVIELGTIYNVRIKGTVRVLKADELDGKALEGVKFELRKDGKKIQEGTTDSDGTLLFRDVEYGTYDIVETQAKEGYVLNETPQTVEVHENGIIVTKEFTNDRIEGNIKVIKKDAEDSSKLEGVRFDLKKDGEIIISRATNADGEILFENLEYGTYTLVEKYAKDGYVLNEEPQEVTIRTNNQVVEKVITNTKIKGSVKVIKTDVEDGTKLAGVQFELQKDGQTVKEGTTDASGEVTFEDVAFGTYTLVEVKAKEGYVLNTEPQKVEIRINGEVVEKVITNKKEPVKPEQPKVEEPKPIKPTENTKPKENGKLKEKVDTNDNSSLSAMILLISGAFLLYRRKK